MALHPDIQATAQAELDAVVGNQRLPGYEDRERLPYIDALSKEVFRFHPIGPMGKCSILLLRCAFVFFSYEG
jgi:cytochrome P450